MRFRFPWSELATLAALYAASAAWSQTTAGATLTSALVLVFAVAATLVPRALLRVSGGETLLGQIVLASSGFAAIAAATDVAGITPHGASLAITRALCASLATGGAVVLSQAIAPAPHVSVRVWLVAAMLSVAMLMVVSGRVGLPIDLRVIFAIASTIPALILSVRYARTPVPEHRHMLVVPAVGTAIGAGSLWLASLLSHSNPIGAAILAAAGTLAMTSAFAVSVGKRALDAGPRIARFAICVIAGCAIGWGVLRVTGSPFVALATAAAATAVGISLSGARSFDPDAGRLLAACERADGALGSIESVDDIATALLEPLRAAARDLQAPAALWVLASETRYSLDVSGAPRAAKLVFQAERALLSWLRARPGDVVFTDALRPLQVRRTELRPVIAALEEHQVFAAIPLLDGAELAGVILVPRGRRRALPSYAEARALADLARRASGSLAMALALERANERATAAQRVASEAEVIGANAIAERDAVLAQAKGAGAVTAVGSLEGAWVGYSESMRALEVRLKAVAGSMLPIALIAEPGCSVAAVVRTIHEASANARGPCVLLDAAGVHPRDGLATLIGSDQGGDVDETPAPFEPVPGWLEVARNGTLAIVDLPALGYDAHIALLDALKSGRSRRVGSSTDHAVASRVVAVTRLPLNESGMPVELCERLSVHVVTVPALRDRAEDLETLVLFGIDRACRVLTRPAVGIRRDALAALRAHTWPGNERELFQTLESAVGRAQGTQLALEDLPAHIRASQQSSRASVPPADGREAEGESYDAMERRILQSALERSNGNKSVAARTLGLARTTFLDKLRKYGLRA